MRFARIVAACAAMVVLGAVVLVSVGSSATPRQQAAAAQPATAVSAGAKHAPATSDGLGIAAGKIKHVWLIILENKSYDATFTGLNRNTYLWQTLPHQGVLLKNYYGTGHFSQDNYISLVSGQATEPDTQSDCPDYTHFAGHVDLTGSLHSNKNYGQMTSAAGPNAAPGANGCVYPAAVPTLFNQLDKAHVSWKGYAQDLGNPDPGALRTVSASSLVARRSRNPGCGLHRRAQPRQRRRHRPVRAQALPVPVVRVDSALGRLQREAHRQCVQQARRPVP